MLAALAVMSVASPLPQYIHSIGHTISHSPAVSYSHTPVLSYSHAPVLSYAPAPVVSYAHAPVVHAPLKVEVEKYVSMLNIKNTG